MLHRMYNDDELEAYEAGQDCGRNGPDQINCHFRHFATPAMTAAWEKGKANGEAERKAQNDN